MTTTLAHVGHYTTYLVFAPILLFVLWLVVSDALTRRRERRSGASEPADRDDQRHA